MCICTPCTKKVEIRGFAVFAWWSASLVNQWVPDLVKEKGKKRWRCWRRDSVVNSTGCSYRGWSGIGSQHLFAGHDDQFWLATWQHLESIKILAAGHFCDRFSSLDYVRWEKTCTNSRPHLLVAAHREGHGCFCFLHTGPHSHWWGHPSCCCMYSLLLLEPIPSGSVYTEDQQLSRYPLWSASNWNCGDIQSCGLKNYWTLDLSIRNMHCWNLVCKPL